MENLIQYILLLKNNVLKFKINKPDRSRPKNLVKVKLNEDGYIKYEINKNILVNGGRELGLKQLNKIKNLKKYDDTRNTVSLSTSLLSAYIKFGCISIREVYWKMVEELGRKNGLVAQLIWREFYFYIAYYFPFVLKGKNYIEKYDKINGQQPKLILINGQKVKLVIQ